MKTYYERNTTMKTKRFFAWVLTLAMLMSFTPNISIITSAEEATPTITQSSTMENQNQAGGVVYTKTSTANSDGTVDITLTAHTTGEVRQMTSVTPTDIVLVLDVSGSMDEDYTTTVITGYEESDLGTYNYYTIDGWFFFIPNVVTHTAYGDGGEGEYYVKLEDGSYVELTYNGRDANSFDMYEYTLGTTEHIVYPELSVTPEGNREHSYDVVQFYSVAVERNTVNKMESLQDAVNAFIDTTALMNQGLEEDEMHNISIVKFASAEYYNDNNLLAVGNNKFNSGTNRYNYSQLVKNLTPVDADGATELKTAVNSLTPGGATAVDYGLNIAEAVLMSRSQVAAEDAVDRKEVIIVFTDGSPTHNTNFEDSVANTAIQTAGSMEGMPDVKVYGVCIDGDADADDLDANINKFMHYMTSNFPNATSMTSGGEGGSIDNGYYMTPNDSTSLSMIFESIIAEIDHPSIELGEEASVIDTLSPYFDFQYGEDTEVILMTSDRQADGTWAEPVEDNSLKYEIIGDKLNVTGFDFDSNYVSAVGRGENGTFYGKRLVIYFKVVPDYAVIDVASGALGDGKIPTNYGLASLVDSDSVPAAEVETPILSAHQITYKVDGEDYAVYNRFSGADATVDPEPTKEGYDFQGWKLNGQDINPGDVFTMPDHDVEIIGEFLPNRYSVSYVYSGTVPAGASALPETQEEVAYGTVVNVAENAVRDGYTFSGWLPLEQDVTITPNSQNGEFIMPDHSVTLRGYFFPDDNTQYTIEHYLETMTDGEYTKHEPETKTGVTDTTATAIPKYYEGFTYDEDNANRIVSGTISATTPLVLKLYYDRNEFDVVYSFTGDVPENTNPPETKTYKYGENVVVEDDPDVDGYIFDGWESLSTSAQAGESFTMPNHAVSFIGEFTASDVEYKVEYYLENLDGTGYELNHKASYTNSGTIGSTVFANQKVFEGFTFDGNNANNKTSGKITVSPALVLKLYYTRNPHTVTYAYEGEQPDGAPNISGWAVEEYKYDETVYVKDDLPRIEGYNFVGWHSTGYTVGNDTESFTMPDRDVVLYGNYEAADGIKWVEKHYFETLDGNWSDTPDYTFDHTGKTGDKAVAEPIKDIVGFTFDEDNSNNVTEALIDPSGDTELKFYYTRNEHTVKYVYDPAEQPDGAPDITQWEVKKYKYGEEVTVEGPLTLQGYDFIGWYPEQNVTVIGGKFKMPDYNVVFEGDFNPRSDTKYEVWHYLETADGTYPETPEIKVPHTATTGESVTAQARSFTGYTLATVGAVTGVVKGDGTLVLKLYYSRNTYTVTYYVTGRVPAGVTAPVDTNSPYRHGAEVTLLPTLEDKAPAGVTFIGWTPVVQSGTQNTVTITDNTFIMPEHNVRLEGRFSADNGIPYTIRHWIQNEALNGYEIYSSDRRVGTTYDSVTAYALTIVGFTDVTDYAGGTIGQLTDEIEGDGSLTLDFYYDRNTHKVTYVYEGIVPSGTPSLPSAQNNVPFGKEITLAAAPRVPGYTFSGWKTTDATVTDGKFNMPDRDVALKGSFSSNEVYYTVNFWLQNIDDDEYTLYEDIEGTGYTYREKAFVGQLVQVRNQSFTGFSLNQEKSTTQANVTVNQNGDGNLVLNVYFDRHTFNVTYVYYGEQPAGAPDLLSKNRQNVRYGTELDVEEKPEFDGYYFDGWYSNTATVRENSFTMPDHHVVFLGRFIKEYTVSYDLKDGTGADGVDYTAKKYTVGTEIEVNANPTRSGYTFKGWKEGDTPYTAGDTVTVDRDMTFVATWQYNGGGGPTITKYVLTYETNGGNSITAESYDSGTNVKLTKVPVKDGFVFEGWYLDEELAEEVESVTMTKNITVYAAWVEDNGNAGNGHDTPEDLNGEDHFAYVMGYPDGTVRPNNNITRAEVTTIFFRLLKPAEVRENNLTTTNKFADITATDWYNTAVSTMAKLGIVNGRTEDTFVPDAFITRAEFAVICARFDNSEFEIVDSFKDVEGHWAEDEIHEAAAHGWIRGYEDNTFRPDEFITRAEAMTMINRVLNRIPETVDDLLDGMITWPDNNDTSAWYYLPVQEATNSHDYEMKNHIYEKWTKLEEGTDWTKYEQ